MMVMDLRATILILVAMFAIGCSEGNNNDFAKTPPLNKTFQCSEKLPEFTLGPYSDPPQEILDELCSCVWNKLDGWEKTTSVAIAEGREKDISAMHLKAFPTRFGSIMNSCGAMDL
jgi:hypothetical protein